MKMLLVLMFVLISCPNLHAENAHANAAGDRHSQVVLDMSGMDLVFPGNGYRFDYSPAIVTGSQKFLIRTGYGQLFTDELSFTDSLLYKGGVGYESGNFFADITYSKNIPELTYAYYGFQEGSDFTAGYKFNTGWTLKNYLYYGKINNLGQSGARFLYDQISVFGSLYSDYHNDIDFRLDFSMTYDQKHDASSSGIVNRFLFRFFNDMIDSRLSLGYVATTDEGIPITYTFDAASYSTLIKQGNIYGNNVAALENKLRIFPLSAVPDIPFISDMFYLSGFFNSGAFLRKDRTLDQLQTTWTAGVGVGMLIFKNDLSFEYGRNHPYGTVWKFSVKTVSITF